MTWELSAAHWERFLANGDGAALLAVLCASPERAAPDDVAYPEQHRLDDVELGGQGYRVSRTIDVETRRERLFVTPTDVPIYGQPGVPYWLHGAALCRWVEEERAHPATEEIDWDAWRGEPP